MSILLLSERDLQPHYNSRHQVTFVWVFCLINMRLSCSCVQFTRYSSPRNFAWNSKKLKRLRLVKSVLASTSHTRIIKYYLFWTVTCGQCNELIGYEWSELKIARELARSYVQVSLCTILVEMRKSCKWRPRVSHVFFSEDNDVMSNYYKDVGLVISIKTEWPACGW